MLALPPVLPRSSLKEVMGDRSPTERGTAAGEKINDQTPVWELLVQWPHSATAPGLQLEVLGKVGGGQGGQAVSLLGVGHLMVAQRWTSCSPHGGLYRPGVWFEEGVLLPLWSWLTLMALDGQFHKADPMGDSGSVPGT